MTSRGKIPKADRLRMVELYQQGVPVREIAEKVGWTVGPIYKALTMFGVSPRKQQLRRPRGSILARARNRIGVW